jgi:predicted negative regulator of RcsB-dependent stress response
MTLPNGYELKSTFWQDFSIADCFGVNAVKDTFNRAFNEWKTDYVYLTELVIVLNWKIWQYYQNNSELSKLYNELWEKADNYAMDNLKDKELRFFLEITD